MLKTIRNILNGLAFGITETVPGVSGGTIAIILGYYNDLISAVNHFREAPRKHLKFLIPLLIGVIIGVLVFSNVMLYLLTNHTLPTMTFFAGLIFGILPHVYSKIRVPGEKYKPGGIALIGAPILFVIVLSGLKGAVLVDPAEAIANIDVPYMLFILFSGIIAAMALVVPGVSGSFVLLLMGVFPLVTYAVSSFRFVLTDPGAVQLMDIGKVLIPLAIGVIIGGLSMCRVIDGLLTKHQNTAYSIIFGLLIGCVVVLLIDQIVSQGEAQIVTVVIAVCTCIVAFFLSFNLGKNRF